MPDGPTASAALATCECATAQIKPAWDGHERLVCEDCYGRITRAAKPLTVGQIARPGEPDCGPETIVWTPAGKAYTRCGCGANLLPGEFFDHAYEAGYRQSVEDNL